MKQKIRLTEGDLHRIVKESVNRVLAEMDWKTYANAAKKRRQQFKDETDPVRKKELWDRFDSLGDAANKKFKDDYVGNWKYDTFGDKLKGKHSSTFDSYIDPSRKDMAYGAINGFNKGGGKLFSTKKGSYYGPNGYTSPGSFFRDKEIGDAYSRANDELWDYDNGDYEYDSIKDGGEGKWKKRK